MDPRRPQITPVPAPEAPRGAAAAVPAGLPPGAAFQHPPAGERVPAGPSSSTSLAADEEFFCYTYKIKDCPLRTPHDWSSCPFAHPQGGERSSRRDPRAVAYKSVPCEFAARRLQCPEGPACLRSHNLFEFYLHPDRWRTEVCQFGAACNRTVCFFAHSMEQLRPAPPSLPPKEVCWPRSGAASWCRGKRTKAVRGAAAGTDGTSPISTSSLPARPGGAAAAAAAAAGGRNPFGAGSPAGHAWSAPETPLASAARDAPPPLLAQRARGPAGAAALPPGLPLPGDLDLAALSLALPQLRQVQSEQLLLPQSLGGAPQHPFAPQPALGGAPPLVLTVPPPPLGAAELGGSSLLAAGWDLAGLGGGGWTLAPLAPATAGGWPGGAAAMAAAAAAGAGGPGSAAPPSGAVQAAAAGAAPLPSGGTGARGSARSGGQQLSFGAWDPWQPMGPNPPP
ncbi:hypothetical protein Rsub_10042 [Raphidocelis subcapitata]|uniref:C3H1-type domain-containing protein n=1 Tax=Raphidocelis subcapitata TaxID=307507 RepID=A0A2V0PBE3_9CHLO|nr:hypothetical protein Rsub_10042 [Raphidocelis subcapitata]|eukprot:GBF97181.1 hypothetical protein Rsub_10042 [Raphidocelis subcapitata]